MTKLAGYHVPGLYVEDHAINVPLDWRGLEPAALAAGSAERRGNAPSPVPGTPEGIKLFYRVVCAPERAGEDLPLLVFLQGGPGGEGPRPGSASDPAWLAEAVKRYRVVLPDQRGTGRSSRVSGRGIAAIGERAAAAGADPTRAQADFLKRFLAGSIVRDLEYLRLTQFGGRRWTTLGQSYGGFLTLCYLSLFGPGVQASFVCGGIPHLPADAAEVYARTFPRMSAKTERYYRRYPQDVERVAAVADRLAEHAVSLPDGSPLTVERLQLLGSDFGMKPSFERMHWLFDHAFEAEDGTVGAALSGAGRAGGPVLSDGFLMDVLARTGTYANPLYWTLQEFIYADGACAPIRWAAAAERARRPEFDPGARPLLFTGEAVFPWMFEQCPELVPFGPAVGLLMEDTAFDPVYDPAALEANEVPLHAAVYFDDMYVDSGLQLDTLAHVGNAHPWVTNEFEHDGLRAGGTVFAHLYEEARALGHLSRR